ncbi:HAD family phosphatase [Erysipelothrix sp. HDW6C]|uniref:HAD family hydrolase n=1 Tax=Erysipelothrix sp. HDW6C TaxID=2714930 RepID=UPI00140BC655|nr:HAD family hydrolase [Erysipelothrix sp. HDW6C]QIK70593.1 HAD family phosphatase [Erysipelothrix sp. HDW6C]
MKHVFVSDFDGTLFKNHEVTHYDLNAIETFREQGHKFGICTGRSIDSILFEMRKYGIPFDFVIGINGGAVLTHELEEIFASSMDESLAREMIQTIDDFGIEFYGVTDGYRLCRVYGNEDALDEFEPNIEITELEEIVKAGTSGFYIHTSGGDKAIALSDRINDLYEHKGIVSFPNVENVDVGVAGVTKATGIAKIVDHYQLEGSVYAVGDSFNDLPMIKAYYGYVMSNGVDAMKKYADTIVESVGDALHHAMAQNHK